MWRRRPGLPSEFRVTLGDLVRPCLKMKNTEGAEAEVESQGCCRACVDPVSSAQNSKRNINGNKYFWCVCFCIFILLWDRGCTGDGSQGHLTLSICSEFHPNAFLTLRPSSCLPFRVYLPTHPLISLEIVSFVAQTGLSSHGVVEADLV